MVYEIKTDQFEGPLELLLDLIEKNRLSINTISLARITDEYILHIKTIEQFRPQEVASFLIVAATLMLIKSRTLLPELAISEEEESDIKELEHRLAEYQRIRDLSQHIQTLVRGNQRMYAREGFSDLPIVFYPPKECTLEDMLAIVRNAIEALPKKEILPERTVKTVVSLEERMEDLRTRMQEGIEHSFKTITGSSAEKIDIIVSFLALLELIKEGTLLVTQEHSFEDISIQKI